MNVIRHSANGLGDSVRRANDAAEVSVEFVAPCALNHWLMIFCAENNVVMQAEMC